VIRRSIGGANTAVEVSQECGRPVNKVKAMDHQFEIVLLGLLVSVVGLLLLATWTHVPYPILLVLGGLGIGFVPGVPAVELEPDLVLLIFLPPLLYAAAFFSNLHELRANAQAIGVLAIGLTGGDDGRRRRGRARGDRARLEGRRRPRGGRLAHRCRRPCAGSVCREG